MSSAISMPETAVTATAANREKKHSVHDGLLAPEKEGSSACLT